MDEQVCHAHSGIVTSIKNLEHSDSKQWRELESMREKIDGIMLRLNIILGGIVVAVISLLLDMMFKNV